MALRGLQQEAARKPRGQNPPRWPTHPRPLTVRYKAPTSPSWELAVGPNRVARCGRQRGAIKHACYLLTQLITRINNRQVNNPHTQYSKGRERRRARRDTGWERKTRARQNAATEQAHRSEEEARGRAEVLPRPSTGNSGSREDDARAVGPTGGKNR